tara:strand:- start:185 stop:433 length:249 start_codon:yes stop_codon:yes gene_type:complete
MKANEINKNLIGKKVKCVNTGEEVNGVITDIYEDEEFIGVKIKHEPVRWGSDVYTTLSSTARKPSPFFPQGLEGNLKYTKLI